MIQLVSDIETNGFLDTLTKVHCIVIKDADSSTGYADQPGHRPIEQALDRLAEADEIIFHNGIKFDIPAIQKVYPRWKPKGRVTDTLIMARLVYPEVGEKDAARAKQGRFPGKLVGSHKLEAWGYRLGILKDEYDGGWDEWSPVMHSYMMQDGEVGYALWQLLLNANYSADALELEHRFAEIMAMQERHGFAFDVAAAQELYAELVKKRLEISRQLTATFPPKEVCETFIPKANSKRYGYVKGVPFTKRKLVDFNPSSRQMIADRLIEKGWEPKEFTPSGQPKIDETILSGLDYPEARVLAEHFLIEKRIGQLAEGDQAWLRLERNGRIHGSVNSLGAVTRRCTHSNPNVAQVPKVGSPYGAECRALFRATVGKVPMLQVGADLSGIELRLLAHYMARYDGGAYAKAVVEGKSEDGTDVHSLNAKALGLDPKQIYIVFGKQAKGRDIAKTFIYAFLYGAGDEKLGTIAGVSEEEVEELRQNEPKLWANAVKRLRKDKRKLTKLTVAIIVKGGVLKRDFLKRTPALKKLREDVAAKAKATGTLRALDGGTLRVRHQHAALNTLLQSAGAIIAKRATVLAYDNLSARGLVFGRDWALIAHVHDELQTETKESIADEVGKIIVQSMQEAGRYYNLRCPVDGEYKVGRNWRDTH